MIVKMFSVLLGCPFSDCYAEESRLLLWLFVIAVVTVVAVGLFLFICLFVVCVLWHFPVAGFFSSKSGLYDIGSSPEILSCSAFFSPLCILLFNSYIARVLSCT